MKHSRLVAATVVAATIASLTACSTAESGTDSNGTTSITYAHWGDNEENATLKAMIADFETANPTIKVTANWVQNNYLQQLQTQLAGGKAPTVVQISNTDLAGFARSFAPAKVTPNDFYSANIPDSMKLQGKYYATPFVVKTKVMAINAALWKATGLQVPSATTPLSVDEYIADAKKLVKGSGKAEQYGSAPLWYGGWLTVNGGNQYNTAGTQCTVDSAAAVTAADQVIAAQAADGYAPTLTAAQGQDMFDWLSIGRIAAQPDFGPWNIAQLEALKNASDFALVPDPGKGEPIEVDGLAVTKTATPAQAAAAAKFIAFMSTDEKAQARLTTSESSLGLPVVKSALSAFKAAAPQQNLQAFIDGVSQSPVTASVKANTQISTDFNTGLTDGTAIGTGKRSPASVLPTLNAQCQKTLNAAGPVFQ